MTHTVSHVTVGTLLHDSRYSQKANQKTQEGGQHADRNAQFEFIYREVARRQSDRQPVISVDTKKKEPVGDFKNAGREWSAMGHGHGSGNGNCRSWRTKSG